MTQVLVQERPQTVDASAPPKRRGSHHLVRNLALVVVGLMFGLPTLWMILQSLKPTAEILADAVPVGLHSAVPRHPTLQNYVTVLTQFNFGRNLVNSAIITACQVLGAVVTSVVSGYAFARLTFRGRDALFLVCLAAAFVPAEAIFFPELRLVSSMGLNDTYAGAFLPFMFSPFAIFLMRQSFAELPADMFEAASLDGLGVWRTFLRIGVPNVRAPLVTVTIVQIIWAWNAYVWPLVILQDPNMQTAQVAAAYFKSVPNHPMNGELMAALTMTCLPLVLLATILQKYYVRGLVMSGSKG
jgi:ABC-type glycerol-3-phosphate transport system permease component